MKKLLILSLILICIPVVMAGTVTRTFSETSLSQNSVISITFSSDGQGAFARMAIPVGWSVVDTGGGAVNEGVLRIQVGDSTVVKLQTAGTATLGGSYIIDGATEWIDFTPQKITVAGIQPPINGCEFWEENKDGECNIAIWVWAIGALLVVLLMFGGKRRR